MFRSLRSPKADGGRRTSISVSDRSGNTLEQAATHGLIIADATLAKARAVVQEIKSLREAFMKALAAGEPVLLSAAELVEISEKFRKCSPGSGQRPSLVGALRPCAFVAIGQAQG